MDLRTRGFVVLVFLVVGNKAQQRAGTVAESGANRDFGSFNEQFREKFQKNQESRAIEHTEARQNPGAFSRLWTGDREMINNLDQSTEEIGYGEGDSTRNVQETSQLYATRKSTNGSRDDGAEAYANTKTKKRPFFRTRRSVEDLDPPRLDVAEETLVSDLNIESWSVRCEGEAELAWNFSYISEPDERVQVTYIERNGTNANFVSIAKLEYPNAEDTGLIECYYKESSLQKDTTYVYFEDETLPILYPLQTYLHVRTDEVLVIECRPTNPNYIVVLWKGEEQVASSSTPTGAKWTYSPQKGFALSDIQMQDAGVYECNNTGLVIVVVTRASEEKLPSPVVLPPHNTHFVVGHSFSLSCLAISSRGIRFIWSYPSSVKEFYTEEEHLTSPPQEASHLTVLNATTEHSGTYTCKIRAPGTIPNEASYEVFVKDVQESYVNITSQLTNITVDQGKNLSWTAHVRSFPLNPEIIFLNKLGAEIEGNSRFKTLVDMRKGNVALELANISRSDFGNYTIRVVTSNGKSQDSVSLLVQVKSEPFVSIPPIPAIPKNDSRRVSCDVLAFPQAEVHWKFKACPPGENRCEDFLNVTEPLQKNVSRHGVVTWKEWTGETSGYLKCEAKNDKGSDSAITPITVTDIGYSYVFSFTNNNNKTRIIKNERETVKVIEDDNIEIFCGVVHFLYDSVDLNVPETSGIVVENKTTELSTSLTSGRIQVAMDDSGNYTCEASLGLVHPAVGADSNKTLVLKVKKQKPPVFLDMINVSPEGNEISVDENSEFMISCAVDGVPAPHITWTKDEATFRPYDKKITISSNGQRIMFSFVSAEDAGTYECTAKNRLDSISGSLTLDVALKAKRITTGAIIALVVTAVVVVVLAGIVFFLSRTVKKERAHRKSFKNIEILLFKEGRLGELNPASPIDEQAELLPYDDSWEIPKSNISTSAQLGSGAFGRVVKGKIFGLEEGRPSTTVAIKMCKSATDAAQLRALASELKIMIHLGKHLNIVNLVGANTVNVAKGELWIMVEFCRYGDLLKYIHKHRHLFVDQVDPENDAIDPTILNGEPLSPYPRSRTGNTFQDSSQGSLGPLSPPASSMRYHTSLSSSESGSSPVAASEGSSRLYTDNPGYQSSLDNGVGSPSPSVAQGSPPVFPSSPATSSTPLVRDRTFSNQSVPVGFQQMVSMSPSPTPLSPTLSLPASECPVDSQGNPFTFEITDIPGETAPFTTSDLVCWAWQVAQGMEYLTHRKVLHGDLALRNLLLAYPNVVKISDFGLARDIYKREFYEKKSDDLMPIKWMSVEAIRDRIFTSQSDVWAYGVVLWELFTLGNTPYPSVTVDKNFLRLLEEGYRMEKPKFSNDEIYSIMVDCWVEDPTLRPRFEDISDRLTDILRPELKGHYMNMNEPYLKMNKEMFEEGKDVLAMMAKPDYEQMQSNQSADPNYVNMSAGNQTTGNSDYLNMKGVEMISFSCAQPSTQGTPGERGSSVEEEEEAKTSSQPTGNSYLPMESAGSAVPGVSIFSPRPVNDNPRFTFDGEQFEEKIDHTQPQCV